MSTQTDVVVSLGRGDAFYAKVAGSKRAAWWVAETDCSVDERGHFFLRVHREYSGVIKGRSRLFLNGIDKVLRAGSPELQARYA